MMALRRIAVAVLAALFAWMASIFLTHFETRFPLTTCSNRRCAAQSKRARCWPVCATYSEFQGLGGYAMRRKHEKPSKGSGCRSAFPTSVRPLNTSVDGLRGVGDVARRGHRTADPSLSNDFS